MGVSTTDRRRSLPMAVLVSSRPKQWVKNLLVFAAPGAAGVLGEGHALRDSVLAFVCLCLGSAATYLWNDTADRDVDRKHPVKRRRPVAAGDLSPATAVVIGVVFAAASLAIATAVDWRLTVVVAAYLALTVSYSTWLKAIVVVDVVAVSAGFVLRAIAGGAATDVPISNWFFIVTTFGSLFVVVGKRQGEAAEIEQAGELRPTLDAYTDSYLAFLRTLSASVVLVAYCLWGFETAGVEDLRIPLYELSTVPFGVAMLRYAFLLDAGHGGAPEEVLFSDRPLELAALAWALVYGGAVLLS